MDALQIVLVLMVLIVCVFLIIFGIMFFFIFKEIKNGINKLNKFLETSEEVASEIGKPLATAAGLASAIGVGAKAATLAVKAINRAMNKKDKTYPKVKVVEK